MNLKTVVLLSVFISMSNRSMAETFEQAIARSDKKIQLLDTLAVSSMFGVSLRIPSKLLGEFPINERISVRLTGIKYKNLNFEREQQYSWYQTISLSDSIPLQVAYGNPKQSEENLWPNSHPTLIGTLFFQKIEASFEIKRKRIVGGTEKTKISAQLSGGQIPFDLHILSDSDSLFLISPTYRSEESNFDRIRIEIENHPILSAIARNFEEVVREKVKEALEQGFLLQLP